MRSSYTLLVAAFLAGLIWRFEVEIRGWNGLAWLEYDHLAIPIGGLICLAWIWMMLKSDGRLWSVVSVFAGWGVVAWVVLDFVATAYFVGGPTAAFYMTILGGVFDHVSWLAPMIWGASILALYVGYRVLFPFSLGSWVIGFALWMASWHLGLTMISIIPERGSPDLIHSLKTGWMIPFCVLAVGLPVLSVRVHGNG